MIVYPTNHPECLIAKVAAAIAGKYSVQSDRARRLAVAAMDGIDFHGGNPHDWKTIERVLLRLWSRLGSRMVSVYETKVDYLA